MENELRPEVRAAAVPANVEADGETHVTWSTRLKGFFTQWVRTAQEFWQDESSGYRGPAT